ncbi:MAG: alpha/beta fold hydrolase [Deltaproteobacteria bacterium]|nr:alpha/beta fold hydrolase [Deltaproteobacteria bacterium]MDQ3300144.1 alpha/beta fold hydrolase [Myxococcota bacterium]
MQTGLEVAVGGVQLRAMHRAVGLAAGVRPQVTPDGVAYLARPGRRGLPLVGVHGFGGDKETWLLMAALVPRARGITLVDLPGHGRSADVAERDASIRHHAEAVLRVLDHAGIDRAVLCGNSMGGGVALRLAASWPARVAGLVLVASVGRDVHEGGALAWIDGENPMIPREADIDRFMALVLERPPPVGRAVIRHVITERARRADALHRLFRGFILAPGPDGVPTDLGAIKQRALVIHGEQDRIIDKAVAEDLASALPDAELVVMRGVGHAPQLEAPRHTARIIERFARQLDAA